MKKMFLALLAMALFLLLIPSCGGNENGSSVTTVPDTTEGNVTTEVTDTTTPDTVVVTTVAVTTTIPETLPVTAAPVTTVPVTTAPVTTAPVTTVPEATEAPVTAPPVTECTHAYQGHTTAATCTEDGSTVYTCSRCGDSYTEVISATGHTTKTTTTEATCTESGQKVTKCTVCGTVTKTEAIAAKGHSTKTTTTKATCTKDGKKVTKCTVCGTVTKTEVLAAKGHSYDYAGGSCSSCGTAIPYAKHVGAIKFTCTHYSSYQSMSLSLLQDIPYPWSGEQYFLDGTVPYTFVLAYGEGKWLNEIVLKALTTPSASTLNKVGVYVSNGTAGKENWQKVDCTAILDGNVFRFLFQEAVKGTYFMLHMSEPSQEVRGNWLADNFYGVYDPSRKDTPPPETDPPVEQPSEVLNYDDFKAMWLSQFDLNAIYTQNGSQRPQSSFTAEIRKVLANAQAQGINTVIVQVRPNADSMYPSDYYPMSTYVVGKYGRDASYDPFAIVVEEAHAIGLSVHAWINPMRAMKDAEIGLVSDRFAIKQWYDDGTKNGTYLVKVGANWYLNPAYTEVRQLILDGAKEILQRYDVDGLHMDDYFYPTTDASFDATAYNAYKASGGTKDLANWRREQLNILVKGLFDMTKSVNVDLLFGISPAGNYNTVYNNQYADIYTWCGTAGYLDYICPQVYFGMEHGSFDFVKVATTFQSMIKTDSVKLIIGMSLGKAQAAYSGGEDTWAGTGKREWIEHQDVLKRELAYTKNLDKCVGVAIFCYQYFYDPATGAEVVATQAERSHFIPLLKTITWQD